MAMPKKKNSDIYTIQMVKTDNSYVKYHGRYTQIKW